MGVFIRGDTLTKYEMDGFRKFKIVYSYVERKPQKIILKKNFLNHEEHKFIFRKSLIDKMRFYYQKEIVYV